MCQENQLKLCIHVMLISNGMRLCNYADYILPVKNSSPILSLVLIITFMIIFISNCRLQIFILLWRVKSYELILTLISENKHCLRLELRVFSMKLLVQCLRKRSSQRIIGKSCRETEYSQTLM
jgi:hypothetical protein